MSDDCEMENSKVEVYLLIKGVPWQILLFDLLKRFSAFRALSVNYDTGAGAVGTKDPVFKIKSIILFDQSLLTLFKVRSAVNAITAMHGDTFTTIGALLTGDLFMTMGTFHIQINSF